MDGGILSLMRQAPEVLKLLKDRGVRLSKSSETLRIILTQVVKQREQSATLSLETEKEIEHLLLIAKELSSFLASYRAEFRHEKSQWAELHLRFTRSINVSDTRPLAPVIPIASATFGDAPRPTSIHGKFGQPPKPSQPHPR